MKEELTKSMEQMVYEKIKAAIMNQRISPGVKLIENTISEQLGVSRTPVRNTFRRLEKEGFITIIPNKGAFVINPTMEEITKACEMRKELELMGLRKAIHFIEQKDLEQMERLTEEEFLAFKNKDIAGYLEINKRFHLTIIESSKNNFLIEFAEKMIDQINVYLILYDQFFTIETENIEDIRGLKEHREIITHLRNKDLLQAENVYEKHLNSTLTEWKERYSKDIPKSDQMFL
ncbi:GntR family transcriptional regulator [Sutcliffiella cohnii]